MIKMSDTQAPPAACYEKDDSGTVLNSYGDNGKGRVGFTYGGIELAGKTYTSVAR